MTTEAQLVSARIEVDDSLEAVNDWFYQQRITDGFPVVPPTEERVRRMLQGTSRDAQQVLGSIPPKWAPITIEKVAICAVMAGARPDYLPVILAATEAILEPRFNLYGIQATTGYVGPTLIINGPIAQQLEINSGAGCFGPGWRANATIGRTIRLILMAVGGGIPGVTDRATFGWPGKYAFCFAEDEASNPWGPMHVDKGFQPEQSTVTVCNANYMLPISSGDSGVQGQDVLQLFAANLIGCRAGGHLRVGEPKGGGEPFLVISPDTASVIARDFNTRRDIQQYLYDRTTISFSEIPTSRLAGKSFEQLLKDAGNLDPDGTVHMADNPRSIHILVAGGAGGHCVLLPMWGGRVTLSVTRVIES